LKELGITSAAWGDHRQWGVIHSHRQACLRYLRNCLFALLDDPKMAPGRLKQKSGATAKQIEEHGPAEPAHVNGPRRLSARPATS
jgi:hypothetical protein